MTDTQKLSVFLCHSPADKAAIRDLYTRLSKYPWIDPWLDDEKLLPGHDRNAEIKRALESAHVVVISLSKSSITTEGRTQAEFKFALEIALQKLENAIFIVPLRLEDLKVVEGQIPDKLKSLQYEDYFPNKRRVIAFDKVLKSLRLRANMMGISYDEAESTVSSPKPEKNKYVKEKQSQEKGVVSNAEFPIYEIPFRKNPNFTGRQDIIDSIHVEFNSARNTIPVYAVSGMGGIGKTQIAVQYSYQFVSEYDLVYWIRSETDASLTADYESLTQALQLPVKTKAEQLVYINIVNNWLENTDKKWLLIFDNVESAEKIERVLPHKGNGHILITSQSPNWKELGEDSLIRPFSDDVAREFLRRRLGGNGLEHSDKLNVLLGGLPLALEQASAYMTAHGTPIEVYINLFEEQQSELWKRETPPRDYKSTIMTTWEMAFKKIQESNPVAKQLLNLFAFFGPDDIPISVIKKQTDILPEELRLSFEDPLNLEENLSAIYRYSLAERKANFISFHRLVQDVIRTHLFKNQAAQWASVAVQIMKRAFWYDEYDMKTWANCPQLLPHALTTAKHGEEYSIGLVEAADLYQNVGEYLREQAEYNRASEAIEHAINIRNEVFGDKHEEVARSLNYLGEIKHEQANNIEALSLFSKAFEIFQAVGRLETQHGARNLNNFGRVFLDKGEIELARKYNEQSFAIRRIVLGEEHPETATNLNNFGGIFRLQGELEIAQKYYEEALAISRVKLEGYHPQIAGNLNNLSLILVEVNNYDLAKMYFKEALTACRSVLGDNHPKTATILSNFAGLLEKTGDVESARKYYEESLAVRLTVLGEDHPGTASTLSNIGTMLANQSKYVDARHYIERAIYIIEKVHGPNHHDLITMLSSLAQIVFHLRLYPLARQYAERATKICEDTKFIYKECESIKQLNKSISIVGRLGESKRKKRK